MGKDLAGEDDDGCSAVADFFVLCPRKLNHGFRSWVRDVDLPQDGVAVVCKPAVSAHISVIPSFVTPHRIPPIGSKIILSIALGPRHVRMTSATV